MVVLADEEDVWDKLCYLILNPVEAGLVSTARDYPGLVTLPSHYTRKPVVVPRPTVFFDPKGPTPPTATLELKVPPCFAHMKRKEFVAELTRRLEQREDEIRRRRAKENKGYLGREGVLAQDPLAYPKGLEPRRNLCPKIGAKNKWTRIERIRALQSFVVEHAAAMEDFIAGKLDVVFPAGTYAARVHLGVKCAAPG